MEQLPWIAPMGYSCGVFYVEYILFYSCCTFFIANWIRTKIFILLCMSLSSTRITSIFVLSSTALLIEIAYKEYVYMERAGPDINITFCVLQTLDDTENGLTLLAGIPAATCKAGLEKRAEKITSWPEICAYSSIVSSVAPELPIWYAFGHDTSSDLSSRNFLESI